MSDVPAIPLTPREFCLQLATTKAIADHLAERAGAMRKEGSKYMRRGDNLGIETPDGISLGEVGATKPAPKATVTDPVAFREYMLKRYPEKCVDVPHVRATPAQIAAVLQEFAPHLVEVTREPADWATNEILKASEKATAKNRMIPTTVNLDREMDIPGVTVTVAEPALQVRLADDAVPAIVDMWRSRQVDPFRAIEAA